MCSEIPVDGQGQPITLLETNKATCPMDCGQRVTKMTFCDHLSKCHSDVASLDGCALGKCEGIRNHGHQARHLMEAHWRIKELFRCPCGHLQTRKGMHKGCNQAVDGQMYVVRAPCLSK